MATLIDDIIINQPNRFVSSILISDISDHLSLFILKRNLFTKKSSQQNTNVKYRLINDSTITNLRQSLLCLDLNHISGSDNYTKEYILVNKYIFFDYTIAMESLALAVDNTYRLCSPIKSKTLSNKNLKKPRISLEIISNIKKRQHYFALYCQNKIAKDFYTHFRNFVTGQIRWSRKDYYEHKFNAAKSDIKQTWRIINNIINTKNRKVENTAKNHPLHNHHKTWIKQAPHTDAMAECTAYVHGYSEVPWFDSHCELWCF